MIKTLELPDFTTFISVAEPSQARSRQALDRFLAAGEQLLADNKFEEASVLQIATLAESSVGTFYRVLGDKDVLSLLLLQRFFQSKVASIISLTDVNRWQDKPLQEFVGALIESLVNIYQGRRGVLRALILRASRDVSFRDRVHQMNEFITSQVADVLQGHKAELNHPDPDKAIPASVHILLGALNQYTVTGNLGHLQRDELVTELSRIIIAYLDIRS